MSEELKAPVSIDCWSCGTCMTLDERGENDGDCPICNAEIDIEPYLAKALTGHSVRDARIAELEKELQATATAVENCELFRAELAAIKAPARGITAAVDAAMIEMANISPPMRRSECERLIRAALNAAPVPKAKARGVVIPRLGKFKTSEGGRSYVAEFFKTSLQRHDFTTYINERLAADFACALADGLYQLSAAPAAPAAPAADTVVVEALETVVQLCRNEYTLDAIQQYAVDALSAHRAQGVE